MSEARDRKLQKLAADLPIDGSLQELINLTDTFEGEARHLQRELRQGQREPWHGPAPEQTQPWPLPGATCNINEMDEILNHPDMTCASDTSGGSSTVDPQHAIDGDDDDGQHNTAEGAGENDDDDGAVNGGWALTLSKAPVIPNCSRDAATCCPEACVIYLRIDM